MVPNAAIVLQEEARARAEATARAQEEQRRKAEQARAAAAEAARKKQVCLAAIVARVSAPVCLYAW
jgi:hypothetical protein